MDYLARRWTTFVGCTQVCRLVEKEAADLSGYARAQYEEVLSYYRTMLAQIRHWMRTGFHLPGKFLSLWEKNARAIIRNKSGKTTEFGRRWFITMLTNGYIINPVPSRKKQGMS